MLTFQSRVPVSTQVRRKIATVIHSVYLKGNGKKQDWSGLHYKQGFPVSSSFDFIIDNRAGRHINQGEVPEHCVKHCQAEISTILGVALEKVCLKI